MYEILKTLADAQAGVVMRSQAIQAGDQADDIDRLLKRGEWVSLRRGAYVERDHLDAMDDVQKHRARIHAVMRSLQAPSVVSHVSAVVMHNLPVWGLDLDNVHVSRTDLHSPRTEAGLSGHVALREWSISALLLERHLHTTRPVGAVPGARAWYGTHRHAERDQPDQPETAISVRWPWPFRPDCAASARSARRSG
jgi:hypothetical protein